MPLVRVSEKTHKLAAEAAGTLTKEEGKVISMGEVIERALVDWLENDESMANKTSEKQEKVPA